MKSITALAGGLAGASIVTLIHESVRQFVPQAPRMDLMGEQAISKMMRSAGSTPPSENKLYTLSLTGDVLSNALYYSLAGIGNKKGIILKGALLGLAAGIGAVVLPKPLGLNEAYSSRTLETKIMTVALYFIGGIASAAAMKLMDKKEKD